MIIESRTDEESVAPENTIIGRAELQYLQSLYDRIAELEAIVERIVEKYGDQWGNIE